MVSTFDGFWPVNSLLFMLFWSESMVATVMVAVELEFELRAKF